VADGVGVGDDSESELFFSEGDGEAVALVDAFFFVVLVEDEEVPVSDFFLVAVELVVPVFFSPVVVFLPVVELVVVELVEDAVSFLWAHETENARATRTVMKEKMVFFIRVVRVASVFRGGENRKHIPSPCMLKRRPRSVADVTTGSA